MATESKLPYLTAYGNIAKTLEKVQTASTPDRFTQDFLATKLGLTGGSAKPVIPYLKRTGFLGSDGVPTDLYKRFRNETQRGSAAAEAMKIGYKDLYEINEYVHDAKDSALKGIVVQATGLEDGSSTVRSIIGSFKALRGFANFDAAAANNQAKVENAENTPEDPSDESDPDKNLLSGGLNLGYTINLNLPATSDAGVYNAIFRSLRENLLKDLK